MPLIVTLGSMANKRLPGEPTIVSDLVKMSQGLSPQAPHVLENRIQQVLQVTQQKSMQGGRTHHTQTLSFVHLMST